MKFATIVKAAALLGAALMISGQTNRNWPTVVSETADGGHRIRSTGGDDSADRRTRTIWTVWFPRAGRIVVAEMECAST